jgi:hypothetical protein
LFHQIQLAGFKAFRELQHVQLKPITLIYGANSSGKSSILQSLLLLKQTVEQAENPETLLLPKGTLVNLGGTQEFAYKHDLRVPTSINIMLNSEQALSAHWLPLRAGLLEGRQVGLQFRFRYDFEQERAVIDQVGLLVDDPNYPVATYILDPDASKVTSESSFGYGFSFVASSSAKAFLRLHRANFDHPFWQAAFDREYERRQNRLPEVERRLQRAEAQLSKMVEQERAFSEPLEPTPRREFLEKRLRSIKAELDKLLTYNREIAQREFERISKTVFVACRNFLPVELRVQRSEPDQSFGDLGRQAPSAAALVYISAQLREQIENLIYLGPLREYPERHYVFSGNSSEQVGKSGKMLPEILFQNPTLLHEVNARLRQLNIGYSLQVASSKKTPELSDVFALRLVDEVVGVNASIVDVGFGISQVLPIVVQSMLSHRKTLCIEQPEIHLHPKLQAELGSLFVDCIRKPFENQFIIETHSEHLLLRLQRCIRNGTLTPQEVCVLYVDREHEGSHCLELRLDESGDFIDRWPDGFFEEGYRELFS